MGMYGGEAPKGDLVEMRSDVQYEPVRFVAVQGRILLEENAHVKGNCRNCGAGHFNNGKCEYCGSVR